MSTYAYWNMCDRHHSVIPSFENTINACSSLYYYTLKDQAISKMMTRNGRSIPCKYGERWIFGNLRDAYHGGIDIDESTRAIQRCTILSDMLLSIPSSTGQRIHV